MFDKDPIVIEASTAQEAAEIMRARDPDGDYIMVRADIYEWMKAEWDQAHQAA